MLWILRFEMGILFKRHSQLLVRTSLKRLIQKMRSQLLEIPLLVCYLQLKQLAECLRLPSLN